MERINEQPARHQSLAIHALSWITCAKRPLNTVELQHALTVEPGDTSLEDLLQIDDVVAVCAGLVTVDEESNIIRLVHYTTQEYFQQTWTTWFPDAQTNITKICVTYLCFDDFESGSCATDEEFAARLQLNALYEYAARNWGLHAREASGDLEQLILDFLQSEVSTFASSQAMMASKSYSWYGRYVPRQMTGVHLAAYFGLEDIMTTLLKNGRDADVGDAFGRIPLSWAAAEGYKAVVQLLLDEDGVDVNSRDRYRDTSLSRAAMYGHEAVVRLLRSRNASSGNG
jgi:hypothetical protein